MQKTRLLLIAGLLLLPAAAFAQEDADDSVAVTIYNQGTALVQDVRTFSFDAGVNVLDFTDVAAQIDATSVSFTSVTDPEGTIVLEQNYVYDLVGAEALYNRYIDEEIRITMADGTEFAGILLSARGGAVIVQVGPDGSVLLLQMAEIRDVRFPNLPDGLITRPTLRWTLNSAAAGNQQVELTYLTGGINWTADYNLLLGTDNTSLDLNGWVTLNNNSGTAYTDAQVKLVAGDVNRLPDQQLRAFEEAEFALAATDAAPAPGATQREFFEYQLYEINRRVTVGNNETKQIEFVTGTNVPASTYFVYNASPDFFPFGYALTDAGYGVTGITDVQNYMEFSTGEENGLGADLPAGRVRVYQEDIDGAALLIGENSIDHTPEGEDVSIFLGNAFDLVGERTQLSFQYIASNVIEETYEIELRNRKDNEAVEIRVPETLYRWTNWEII
ncbi:MAG: hypothetical protein AAF787_07110, partial [Chloroflexota bacterium]